MPVDVQKERIVVYISEFLKKRRIGKIEYNRMKSVIRARAVVDIVSEPPPHGGGLGTFDVEVWGVDPGQDYVRRYRIQAKSDTIAAREGLDRFVEDIGKLISAESDK